MPMDKTDLGIGIEPLPIKEPMLYFYKVTNDILIEYKDNDGNVIGRTTDEPKWLRDTIDSWKDTYGIGGRVIATEDALYSYIVAPEQIDNDGIEEIGESDINDALSSIVPERSTPAIYKPDNVLEIIKPEEIIASPTIDSFKKSYMGYGLNHTGTISASETWALVDSPHHITGNITVNQNVVVTIAPGCNIYVDGNYSIIMNAGSNSSTLTKWVMTGTVANRITMKSNATLSGTGQAGDYVGFAALPNNSELDVQYCDIQNASLFISITAPTAQTLNIDHCTYTCLTKIINFPNGASATVTLANCLIDTSADFSTGTSGTVTINLTDCRFVGNAVIVNASTLGVVTVNFTDCRFENSPLSILGTLTFTRCLEISSFCIYGATDTAAKTITDCIITRSASTNVPISVTALCTSAINITTTDIIGGVYASTGIFAINQASAATTPVMTSCYIAGWKAADPDCYYTGVESPAQVTGAGTITYTTPRTTRNFNFVPASIAVSSITDNGATISWNSGFRTQNRIRFGLVSGTYTAVREISGDSWSNYNGMGQMTKTPSLAVSLLSPGTTYYYVVESYDWYKDVWVTSTEVSFLTTGTNQEVLQLDLATDKARYSAGDTITITGDIKLLQTATGVTVTVTANKLSDDSLVATILSTTYNFTANTLVTLNTINGGVLTYIAPANNSYYIKLVVSGGTPAISASDSTSIRAQFDVTTNGGSTISCVISGE